MRIQLQYSPPLSLPGACRILVAAAAAQAAEAKLTLAQVLQSFGFYIKCQIISVLLTLTLAPSLCLTVALTLR